MATISICGAIAAALEASPVQRLLLARELGGALPADARMLQELCALEGSDGRRRQRQRQRHHRHLATRRTCFPNAATGHLTLDSWSYY